MFIIDDIISWIVGKILDKFFSKKDENIRLVKYLNERITKLQSEKEELAAFLNKEKSKRGKEQHKIIDSLKRRGVSVDKLIERYDKPLLAVLISYASQGIENEKGKYKSFSFLREELEKYGSKYLGGTDVLIPPAKLPEGVRNKKSLENWFEKEILKGRFCKIKFMVLVDLKKKVFWKTYLPYKQKEPMHFTIGEKLSIEDIFTEKQINKISISKIIRDGDIAWLASSFLTEKDLDVIMANQSSIEEALSNPSLRDIANKDILAGLVKALSPLISNPKDAARKIIEEAKYWEQKLK